MAWQVVWVDTDKTIERDDVTGAERASWTNPHAVEPLVSSIAAMQQAAHADGEAWVQPTGAHDAYPLGITTTDGGKTWTNLIPSNVWRPGVSGWREVVAEGHPAWVQPTGGHDAYTQGAQVTHAGQTWTSNLNGNVWEPGVYGWTAN